MVKKILRLVFVCVVLYQIFYLALTFPSGVTYNHPCPKVPEIQDPWVAKNFDRKKFEGIYYEWAYHDYNQPGMCKCQQSVKVFDNSIPQLNESYYLYCSGIHFESHLTYNLTNITGHFLGHWPFVPNIVYPNTLVDVHTDENGDWVWVIEFQCVEVR